MLWKLLRQIVRGLNRVWDLSAVTLCTTRLPPSPAVSAEEKC